MLISRQHLIAFAHYPKTAGCSVQRWFIGSFPDPVLLRPKNPHLCVADSLKKLSRWKWTWPIVRLATSQSRFALPRVRDCVEPWPVSLRVVGVLREPFEMFVSLYEYWRRDVFPIEPIDPFILLARHGEFRNFLAAAVIGKRMSTYEDFFNVGGPPHTKLLDFDSLQAGLASFCHGIGIPNSKPLPAINQNPNGVRDIQRNRDEVGPLVAKVHQRFRWYYEEGIHLTIRTSQPLKVAA